MPFLPSLINPLMPPEFSLSLFYRRRRPFLLSYSPRDGVYLRVIVKTSEVFVPLQPPVTMTERKSERHAFKWSFPTTRKPILAFFSLPAEDENRTALLVYGS
ncbi:hypothetical protein GWI33_003800 [Rhynchophorus ferrugineus]|uniref:Uncharacterized protein n=1 Tax=Rhynchophorus ferrugineus TaxID=354439 RepID=A0A834HKG1_RHYFE|nr:hypothetical protein GWI33_003803 [Rhynchophorus ferrugineus]KAF7262954.1 hypothetical protein GWI33_003800 [Rhynchophorus ferrugineus]